MLNHQHRRGRYISRDVRLRRWCFPRWQRNEGRPDIQAFLSPLCTSLFPVSEEQEARKKKTSVLWFTRYGPQQPAKQGQHQWGSDSSFIQSGRGDDHLSSAALVLSSPCSLDCVLLSDWHEECVLFHLRPLKPVQDMCLRFISVCNWCCLHVCRSWRVCGGAASVSAEVHQHVRFLSVQLCWRISTSSRSDLLHRCVCVCGVALLPLSLWMSLTSMSKVFSSTSFTIFPDVDECLLPAAVTGCVFGCVNTLGSFHCQCPAGYSLQSADAHCQG